MLRKEIEVHEPLYSHLGDVFLETIEQLRKPHPSIKLLNWPLWNELTGGLRSREFSILCGSTGSGKTTFLANLSAQLLKQNEKHLVMSVETGRHDFMRRILSALAGADLNTGEAVPEEIITKVYSTNAKYLERTRTIEFSHYEDRLSCEQLIYDLECAVERGCKIAMLDNLNFFLEVTTKDDSILEMDRVIHELILFCKRSEMHIFMVMHPKKVTDREARVESEFDIKGSATAVQEAQNVFLFNRPKMSRIEEGLANYQERELALKKMRRRGVNVGRTLIFDTSDGTTYHEKGFLEWAL